MPVTSVGASPVRLLLLEQSRQPELSLFPAIASQLGGCLTVVDPQSLRLDLATTAGGARILQGSTTLQAADYDALVVRSYRAFALARALAEQFASQNKPILGLDPHHKAFAQDKFSDLQALAAARIPIPPTWSCRPAHLPQVVAKANWGFGGHGVELLDAGEDVAEPWNTHYQPLLTASHDWRILVCEGRALPWVVVRYPAPGDFRTNTHQGGVPEVLPAAQLAVAHQLMELAERASVVLGRPSAGVDLRQGPDGQPVVLEVNRTPRLRLGAHTEDVVRAYLSAWLSRVRQWPQAGQNWPGR